jgi:hypothetical protein
MLYYLFLFMVFLVMALVVFWLYKEVTAVARKNHGARLSGSSEGPTSDYSDISRSTAISDAPTPRDDKGFQAPRKLARTKAASPSEERWSADERDLDKHGPVIANFDGSKTNSHLWSYGAKPDRPRG